LLAWSISLKNFGTPLIAYLAGINHLRSQSAIAVIQSAIIIGVTILFLQQGGIVTIGWATVVAEILASVVLPIYYASHSIGQIGGSISRKQLFLSLFAVGIVGAIFVGVSFKYWDVYIGSVIGIPLLLIIYWFEWIELPIEIKIRLMKLIPFLQYKRK
jgi:hypothetical protein